MSQPAVEPFSLTQSRRGRQRHARFLLHLVAALQSGSPTLGIALAFTLRSAAPMTAPTLRRQLQYLQQFLLETAILKRFHTSLARAVTGRADSRNLREEAQSKNRFIFSLDDQRHWYRYRHLFTTCSPTFCNAGSVTAGQTCTRSHIGARQRGSWITAYRLRP